MRLKKDNGKDIVIVTEGEVIIKRIFKDKIVKKDNILSACLLEDLAGNKGIVILTKDYKIIEKRKINLRWKEREKLKLVIDDINNNNILFNYKRNDSPVWIVNCINTFFLIAFNEKFFNNCLIFLLYVILICSIVTICFNNFKFRGILYDLNKEEFFIIGKKNKIIDRFRLENIEILKKGKDNRFKCRVKNSYYKFIVNKGVISYPTVYEKIVDDIEKECS